MALQAAQIEAVRFGGIARGDHVGRYIHERDRPQRRHAVGADAAKLMRHGKTAQHGVIADRNMAREAGAVGENSVVADLAIVREVAIRHDEIVVTQARDPAARHRAAVEGTVLTDNVAVADVEARGLALVVQMLRRFAQRDELVDAVVAPDAGRSIDDGMRANPRTLADLDIRPDNAVGPDLDILGNMRLRVHDRLRVDHEAISLYVHISSALQQSSLPT